MQSGAEKVLVIDPSQLFSFVLFGEFFAVDGFPGFQTLGIVLVAPDQVIKTVGRNRDLLYHLVVLLVARGVSLEEIAKELKQRRGDKSERA